MSTITKRVKWKNLSKKQKECIESCAWSSFNYDDYQLVFRIYTVEGNTKELIISDFPSWLVILFDQLVDKGRNDIKKGFWDLLELY